MMKQENSDGQSAVILCSCFNAQTSIFWICFGQTGSRGIDYILTHTGRKAAYILNRWSDTNVILDLHPFFFFFLRKWRFTWFQSMWSVIKLCFLICNSSNYPPIPNTVRHWEGFLPRIYGSLRSALPCCSCLTNIFHIASTILSHMFGLCVRGDICDGDEYLNLTGARCWNVTGGALGKLVCEFSVLRKASLILRPCVCLPVRGVLLKELQKRRLKPVLEPGGQRWGEKMLPYKTKGTVLVFAGVVQVQ